MTLLGKVGDQVVQQCPNTSDDLVLPGAERPDLVEGQGDQVVPGGGRHKHADRSMSIGDDAGRQVLGGGVAQHVGDAMEALDRRGRVVHRR